jgi:alkylated DNA nucleotide flippase Atl1
MPIKSVTYGQDTIIIGRGATEQAAWTLARKISAKRKNWHSVYHKHDGDWHKVICYEGRDQGHVYDTGGLWWSDKQTVRDRAEELAKS